MFVCIHICIYTHIHTCIYYRKSSGGEPRLFGVFKRGLECGIPSFRSPVNSRRFPEIFRDFCKNKPRFLQVSAETVFSRLLPYIFVENRSPYPVLKFSLISGETGGPGASPSRTLVVSPLEDTILTRGRAEKTTDLGKETDH